MWPRIVFVLCVSLLLASSLTSAADALLLEQLKQDVAIQIAEVSPNVGSDQRQSAVDAIVADVSHTCPGAFTLDPRQTEALRAGQCPFSDDQLMQKYSQLKQLAGGKPMPLLVEFYRKRFERGELTPVQKTLYFTLTSAIADNTQRALDSQKKS